jgi:DNA ligase (NAD+)
MSNKAVVDIETEGDLLEEALPILDSEFEAGTDCLLPADLYDGLRQYPLFNHLSNPVTDPQYDAIKKRLKKLRPELFEPGGKFEGTTASQNDFSAAKKIKHSPPMTSVKKADGDLAEKSAILKKFLQDCMNSLGYTSNRVVHGNRSKSDPAFAMSFKRDGVSVRLYYEKGKLVRAGVRPRDGINGADVLAHVRYVKGVPQLLPEPIDCAIGGELEIRLPDFEAINQERVKTGEKLLANPRNATAGAMNPLGDPDVVRQRRVSFIGHSIHMDNPPYRTAIERAKYANQHLKVPFVRVEEFDYQQLAKMEALVPQLDYEVDGIVIEVNHLEDQENLGQHGGSVTGDPVGKIAWKFLEQKAMPEVSEIVWQAGRTGKITPVCKFPGVRLAGTTVTNASAHNLGRVQAWGIGKGAVITVYKAGKIIPFIENVVKKAPVVDHPQSCPACNSATSIKKGASGTELWCDNANCPAKLVGTFVHYLSTFGVKGVAESVVTAMIGAGLLHTYADFYRVTPEQLEKAGLTEREAVLAYARIHMIDGADQIKNNTVLRSRADKAAANKKEIDIAKLIAALGIPGAAKGTGRDLTSHFRDFDRICKATEDDFLAVPNVGDSTAASLAEWFSSHCSDLDELLKYVEPQKPKSGKFNDMSFVFTGGQPDPGGKDYWEEKVEANEGR